MIGYLRGQIVKPGVVDVAGVGYVFNGCDTFAIGDSVSLHVTTLSPQGVSVLYGFSDPLDQLLFGALIKIPKIGPAAALSILRTVSPPEFARAVTDNDTDTIAAAPGVSEKTAAIIIANITVPIEITPAPQLDGTISAREVTDTLVDMGHDRTAAERVVAHILDVFGDGVTEEVLLRKALSALAKAKK
jgi:Holliday junction resolvasome RuvABC DNA-binding subunit